MADDWIKMRTDLYRDPKVCVIADLLMKPDSQLSGFISQHTQSDSNVTRNVMRNMTVGALVSVWGVLRHRGKRVGNDLFIKYCTIDVIDDVADLAGFGMAMQCVGWVSDSEEGIVFNNFFEDFNTDPHETAKSKAAERQRKYRERKKEESNENSNVTVTSQSDTEKRREESKKNIQKKENQTTKKTKTSIPNDFKISDRVANWANENGFENLNAHLENFIIQCRSKNYQYADWDSAFMVAIRKNWAEIKTQPVKREEKWG